MSMSVEDIAISRIMRREVYGRMTVDERQVVCGLQHGETQREIAREMGVSQQRVGQIIGGMMEKYGDGDRRGEGRKNKKKK